MDYSKIYRGNNMSNRDYMVVLYDYYSELLNEKQKTYFEEYYFQNLSLGEISQNLSISRNAVHKVIQGVEEKLQFYEEKLKLYYKTQIIYDIIKKEKDKNIKEQLKGLVNE